MSAEQLLLCHVAVVLFLG